MQNGASCAPITDYSTYANRVINITSDTSITNVWGSCSSCIGGCTSSTATNYNSNADYDDGSCNYNTNFNVTFQVDMNNVTDSFTIPEVNGTFNNWCGSCWAMSDVNNDNIWTFTASVPAGSYEYKFAADNWTIQEDLSNAGNCVVSAWGFTNRFLNITSDTVISVVCWESCSACPATTCANAAPTGLNATNVVQNRATINWDNMNDTNCMVDQYRIKYSGDAGVTWTQKTMGQPVGSCLWATQNTDKLILNLIPSTTYEYQMKAWYCGGGNSAWTAVEIFTTLSDCPNVGNLAVSTPSTTKATFTWDDSNGPYSFVRIKSRVDTTGGTTWFNVGGVGVPYGIFTKDKNNLSPGTSYRAQARTWCDPAGGAWKSPTWTSLVYWTQPPVIRLEGGSAIDNLDVYPNPSLDIFNITFTSEDVQDLKVKIVNVIGEELLTEDLQQFIGEYTKQIDLSNNAKGIYFLEITTNNGLINKKLILL
jgi:hypothetical protein